MTWPSNAVIATTAFNSWIVCEREGRWSAALRIAIERQTILPGRPIQTLPVCEVRSLAELESAMQSQIDAQGLVEARPDNLAAVLELLAKSWRRNVRLAALLDSDLGQQPSVGRSRLLGRRLATEVLMEAGALTVIDSPRYISTVLDLARRRSEVREATADPNGNHDSLASLANQAWAALPWQGA